MRDVVALNGEHGMERERIPGDLLPKGSRSQLLRRLYEESPIGIGIFDPDGRLVDANRACLDIFGISGMGEVQNISLFDDPHVKPEARAELLAGRSIRYEAPLDAGNGRAKGLFKTCRTSVMSLDVWITPLDDLGEKIGYLVQIQDVTRRAEAEREVRDYRRYLYD